MQVRASNGARFFLEDERMVESARPKGMSSYFLFRKDLKTALQEDSVVYYGFTDAYEAGKGMVFAKYLTEGKTQRNKKYISIGCMRFVGQERIKLLRWAKA